MHDKLVRNGDVYHFTQIFQVKMNRMRQRIAQRLKDAQNACAMLTTFNEIDMRYVWVKGNPDKYLLKTVNS